MSKGRTFSITLPHIMVKEYDRQARELKISRSKIIFNILLSSWVSFNPDKKIIDCAFAEGINCTKTGKDCNLQESPEECIWHIHGIENQTEIEG